MKKVIVGKSKGIAEAKQCDIHVVVKSFYCHDNKWTTNAPVCDEQCKYCTDLKKY